MPAPFLPAAIADESELDDVLATPTEPLVETFRRLDGDLAILGVAGKMGPSLARLARRAADLAGFRRRIFGVSRFRSDERLAADLAAYGIEPIRADLLDPVDVERLPEAPLVVYLAGRKFGSNGDESATWVMNTVVPGLVARRYACSRIVALSTGNVYPFVPSESPGAHEETPPAPVGEYAMSCLGRERVFEYHSRTSKTPLAIIRLNYACDLRYGVPVDLARQVRDGEPVDLRMGHFNVIWQGDANAIVLRALEHAASPPWIANVTGPETLAVRDVCNGFASRMGTIVRFVGVEEPTALLSDASKALRTFGPPRVSTRTLLDWVADWVARGGRLLDKPTRFQVRDGRF